MREEGLKKMTFQTKSKTFLLEPLIQFLIIGAIVFGLHSFIQSRLDSADRTISISAKQIERLTAIWSGEAGREPTPDDVRGLVTEYIREEVLYREALRLGLDRDDTIVRRRLAQKMGFLVAREGDVKPLSEVDLRAAFEASPDVYTRPDRVSFTHVPFNFLQDEAGRADEIKVALGKLSAPGSRVDPRTLGDAFLLARTHIELSQTEVARLFGREFADTLFKMEVNEWSGPHRSRLALHLVRLDRRFEGGLPDFKSIIEDVRANETLRQQQGANEAEMSKLLERYTIILNDDPV